MKFRNFASTSVLGTVAILASVTDAWFFSVTKPLSYACQRIQQKPYHNLKLLHSLTTTTTTTVKTTTKSFMSPAAVEEEERTLVTVPKSPTTAMGKTIAEGTVVSHFPGGLTAVRISEEFATDNDGITLTTDGLRTPGVSLSVKVEVGDYQGKQVLFSNGNVGVIVAHRPPLVFVYTDTQDSTSSSSSIIDDGHVIVKDSVASVEVSTSRQVVDCFGRLIQGEDGTTRGKMNDQARKRNIFSPIPQVKDIALINNPMLTGYTMIDTLASIGRGQNMLLVGHDSGKMRGLVIDFLQTQVSIGKNTKCVYAATGEHSDSVLQKLKTAGIENKVQVVVPKERTGNQKADEASKAAEAVSIAATACAIGESYALDDGKNSLVIIDTLDYHKTLWDSTTRVLVDVFGKDAVVKSDRDGGASSEMRGFFSSLIQRAAQFKKSRGGGSVTLLLLVTIPLESSDENIVFSSSDFEEAPVKIKERINLLVQKKIPLTAAILRKINIPIPSASEGERRFALQHIDDLISMTDGQIWLDERLEASGRTPAVDPQRSVTRIGIGADTQSRADAPAIRRIAEGLRLELSQAADTMEGVDSSLATKAQNRKKLALLLAMHQKTGSGGRRLSESCIVLLAAQRGHLDGPVEEGALAGTEKGEQVIADLLDHVQRSASQVMNNIDSTLDMSDEEQEILNQTIQDFFD